MSRKRTFEAVIQSAGEGGGAFVDVPFDVQKEYGKGRVPILAHIESEPYRGTLVRMGRECHMLLIRKDIREKIAKGVGDTVHVTLEEDTQPRTIEVPEDLATALAGNPKAAAFFDTLSFTHRKEYVQWVTEARRDATRVARVQKAVRLLEEGKKER